MISKTLLQYTKLTKYRAEYIIKYINTDDLLFNLLQIASYSKIQCPTKVEFESLENIEYSTYTSWLNGKEKVKEIITVDLKLNVIFNNDMDEETSSLWNCLLNAYFRGLKTKF
jgi:hypothetical protein